MQASIEFIPEGRKLINRGYPWGAEVSASGTYEVIDPVSLILHKLVGPCAFEHVSALLLP